MPVVIAAGGGVAVGALAGFLTAMWGLAAHGHPVEEIEAYYYDDPRFMEAAQYWTETTNRPGMESIVADKLRLMSRLANKGE